MCSKYLNIERKNWEMLIKKKYARQVEKQKLHLKKT